MAFPTSPTDGQLYNGYQYNSTLDLWKKYIEDPNLYNHKGIYSHDNGILVKTDIAQTSNSMTIVDIFGNSYDSTYGIKTQVSFYWYPTNDAFLQPHKINMGNNFNINVFFDSNNLMNIWWSELRNFQTFFVKVTRQDSFVNRITSIEDASIPTTRYKEITI